MTICKWLRRLCGGGSGNDPPPVPIEPIRNPASRPARTRILVYLRDTSGIPYSDAAADALKDDKDWQNMQWRYGSKEPLRLRRVFTSDPGELAALIRLATQNAEKNGVRGYVPLEFDHWYFVPLPLDARLPVFDLYCDLKAWAAKRGGYARVSEPTIGAGVSTAYIGPAAVGVGASGLTSPVTEQRIDGAGQRVADLEKGWIVPANTTNVQMMPDNVGIQWAESTEETDRGHGAATFGVIHGAAGFNAPGIAPAAIFIRAPILDNASESDSIPLLEASILNAAIEFKKLPGLGVILIEQQLAHKKPVEVEGLVFAAIATAVASHGLVVIEPAGNNSLLLDSVEGETTQTRTVTNPITNQPEQVPVKRKLDPTAIDEATGQPYPTSGAIMVAAGGSGQSAAPPAGERTPTSNHGKIIDCWAWGDSIATLYWGVDSDGNIMAEDHATGYGGTSGAAAIVAGAVLLMQHLRSEARQSNPALPLTATEVRTLLRGYGTPGQGDLRNVKMPNLQEIRTKIHADRVDTPSIN